MQAETFDSKVPKGKVSTYFFENTVIPYLDKVPKPPAKNIRNKFMIQNYLFRWICYKFKQININKILLALKKVL